MPVRFISGKSRHTISVTGDMVINFPQAVVEEANLQVGTGYDLFFTQTSPLTVFFAPSERGDYTLSYHGTNSDGYTGGKLTLRKFYNDIASKRIKTPLRDRRPILLRGNTHADFAIGVMLEDPLWLTNDLSKEGMHDLNQLSGCGYGVYQYLGIDGEILKIGEGILKDRLRQHVQQSWHDVHSARYFPIHYKREDRQKPDGELLEQVFLNWFEDDHGRLPKYNRIRR